MTCGSGVRCSTVNFAKSELSIHLGRTSGLQIHHIEIKTFCFLEDALDKSCRDTKTAISVKRIDRRNPWGFVRPSLSILWPKADHSNRQVGIAVYGHKSQWKIVFLTALTEIIPRTLKTTT